jgi:hypothetical protein
VTDEQAINAEADAIMREAIAEAARHTRISADPLEIAQIAKMFDVPLMALHSAVRERDDEVGCP